MSADPPWLLGDCVGSSFLHCFAGFAVWLDAVKHVMPNLPIPAFDVHGQAIPVCHVAPALPLSSAASFQQFKEPSDVYCEPVARLSF